MYNVMEKLEPNTLDGARQHPHSLNRPIATPKGRPMAARLNMQAMRTIHTATCNPNKTKQKLAQAKKKVKNKGTHIAPARFNIPCLCQYELRTGSIAWQPNNIHPAPSSAMSLSSETNCEHVAIHVAVAVANSCISRYTGSANTAHAIPTDLSGAPSNI
jgi:hypothetical protein